MLSCSWSLYDLTEKSKSCILFVETPRQETDEYASNKFVRLSFSQLSADLNLDLNSVSRSTVVMELMWIHTGKQMWKTKFLIVS